METKLVLLLLVVLAVSTVFAASTRVAAATNIVYVDDDGNDCPYANYTGTDAIQQAIENEPPYTRIYVCPGVYDGLTNRIYDQFTGTYTYKPVEIIGYNGTPIVDLSQKAFFGDANLSNLKFISNNIGFEFSGRIKIENVTIEMYTPSIFWGIPASITIDANTDITVENSVISGGTSEVFLIGSDYASSIVIRNTVIDCGARLNASYILLENITKTKAGENPIYYVGGTGFALIIVTPHPSLHVDGETITILNSTFEGSVFVNGNSVNITNNIFNANGYVSYNYYKNRVKASGAMLYVNGSGVIAYNVFKNAGYLASKYSDPFIVGNMWGVLLVGGTYTVTRNLFADNLVGAQFLSSSLVYDNMFVDNEVQAVVNASSVLFNIDPPLNNTNVVGGPYQGGNYWSDYNGVDEDGDGLGDTPYTNAYGVVDGYPLVPPATMASCPPFSGGLLAVPGTLPVYTMISASLLVLSAYATKRKGMISQIGLIAVVGVALALTILAVFVVYSPSTNAVTKSAVVVNTIGEPVIAGGQLQLVLYNPTPYPVCVEKVFVEGRQIPVVVAGETRSVDIGLLETAILSHDIQLTAKAFEPKPITLKPRGAVRLIGTYYTDDDVVSVTVVTNAGTYNFYARVED